MNVFLPNRLKNPANRSLGDLESLVLEGRADIPILLAYCNKLLDQGGAAAERKCLKQLSDYHKLSLVENADPMELARLVLRIPITVGSMPTVFYLKLGSHLEAIKAVDDAGLMYRRIFDIDRTGEDAEAALLRLGLLLENHYRNRDQAYEAYSVQLSLFPVGEYAEEAKAALVRLGFDPAPAASTSNAARSKPGY